MKAAEDAVFALDNSVTPPLPSSSCKCCSHCSIVIDTLLAHHNTSLLTHPLNTSPLNTSYLTYNNTPYWPLTTHPLNTSLDLSWSERNQYTQSQKSNVSPLPQHSSGNYNLTSHPSRYDTPYQCTLLTHPFDIPS